jgi:hypothetical protein
MARWQEGNVGKCGIWGSITAREKYEEGFVYGTSFCGPSVIVVFLRYSTKEWNIKGIDKMRVELVDSAV